MRFTEPGKPGQRYWDGSWGQSLQHNPGASKLCTGHRSVAGQYSCVGTGCGHGGVGFACLAALTAGEAGCQKCLQRWTLGPEFCRRGSCSHPRVEGGILYGRPCGRATMEDPKPREPQYGSHPYLFPGFLLFGVVGIPWTRSMGFLLSKCVFHANKIGKQRHLKGENKKS